MKSLSYLTWLKRVDRRRNERSNNHFRKNSQNVKCREIGEKKTELAMDQFPHIGLSKVEKQKTFFSIK